MDTQQIVQLLGTGGVASLLFQAGKGDWNEWLTRVIALTSGFASGYAQGGLDGGLISASAMLAAHGAFLANTKFGDALKISLVPRVLRVLSEVAMNLAKAIENKPPSP